mmetsp:Transcript_121103/g.287711  ORF Transcript_121103/g.287711 Transcript_121103/m.287711 type:complete len:210 (-) Transcript_121103:22-651(-)
MVSTECSWVRQSTGSSQISETLWRLEALKGPRRLATPPPPTVKKICSSVPLSSPRRNFNWREPNREACGDSLGLRPFQAEPGAKITRKSSRRSLLNCGETSGKPQLALNLAPGFTMRHVSHLRAGASGKSSANGRIGAFTGVDQLKIGEAQLDTGDSVPLEGDASVLSWEERRVHAFSRSSCRIRSNKAWSLFSRPSAIAKLPDSMDPC